MQNKIPRTIKQLEVRLRLKYWLRTILDEDGDRWVYMRDIDSYTGNPRPEFIEETTYLKGRYVDLGSGPKLLACIHLPLLMEYFKVLQLNSGEAEYLHDAVESTWREWMGIGIIRDPEGPIRQTYKLVYRNMLEAMEFYAKVYNVIRGESYHVDGEYLYRMFLMIIKRDQIVDFDDLSNMEVISLTNLMAIFTAMVLYYLGNPDIQKLIPINGVIETQLYRLRDMFDVPYSTLDVMEDLTLYGFRNYEFLYDKDETL